MKYNIAICLFIMIILVFTGCEKATDSSVEDTVESKVIELGESQMYMNRYFFLDEVYRLQYYAKYVDSLPLKKYLDSLNLDTVPHVKEIEIYKHIPGIVIPDIPDREFLWGGYKWYDGSDTIQYRSIFRKLEKDKDYFVNIETGIIVLTPMADSDVIAIYMKSKDDNLIVGDYTVEYDTLIEANILSGLHILKQNNYLAAEGSPNSLMMRNIYALCGNNPRISIIRITDDGSEYEKNENGIYYGQILGLMNDQGEYDYTNEDIFDYEHGYLIIPPHKSNDNGVFDENALLPFTNPALGVTNGEKNWGDEIYDDNWWGVWEDRFRIRQIIYPEEN